MNLSYYLDLKSLCNANANQMEFFFDLHSIFWRNPKTIQIIYLKNLSFVMTRMFYS